MSILVFNFYTPSKHILINTPDIYTAGYLECLKRIRYNIMCNGKHIISTHI